MKIAMAAWGSAGDVNPTISLSRGLSALGHTVIVLSTPALAGYVRYSGVMAVPIGRGDEAAAIADAGLYNLRFDGLGSWRRLLDKHVAPWTAAAVADGVRVLGDFRPDVVLAHPFAAFAAVASERLSLPWGWLTLYPDLYGASRAGMFGGAINEALADVPCGRYTSATYRQWLASGRFTFVTQDHSFGRELRPEQTAIGYPYWDGTGPEPERIVSFKEAQFGRRPVVVVTAGSFLGARVARMLEAVTLNLVADGYAVILLNAPGTSIRDTSNVLVHPYARLSQVLVGAEAIVHHGGLGTTHAAIGAQVPSVVVPIAFDQRRNGRSLAEAGIGMLAEHPSDIGEAIGRLTRSATTRTRLQAFRIRAASLEEPAERVVAELRDMLR